MKIMLERWCKLSKHKAKTEKIAKCIMLLSWFSFCMGSLQRWSHDAKRLFIFSLNMLSRNIFFKIVKLN